MQRWDIVGAVDQYDDSASVMGGLEEFRGRGLADFNLEGKVRWDGDWVEDLFGFFGLDEGFESFCIVKI